MAEHEKSGKAGRPLSTMLATGEVAGIFSVHESTIRRWSEQGILKSYRIGPRGDRRYRQEDVTVLYLDRAIEKHLQANLRCLR